MNQRRARGGTKTFGRLWDKLRGNPPRTRGGNPLVVVGRREAKPNAAPSGRQTMEIRDSALVSTHNGQSLSPCCNERGMPDTSKLYFVIKERAVVGLRIALVDYTLN